MLIQNAIFTAILLTDQSANHFLNCLVFKILRKRLFFPTKCPEIFSFQSDKTQQASRL